MAHKKQMNDSKDRGLKGRLFLEDFGKGVGSRHPSEWNGRITRRGVVFVLVDRWMDGGSNAQIRVNIQRQRYIWHVGRTGTNIGALERRERGERRGEGRGGNGVCACMYVARRRNETNNAGRKNWAFNYTPHPRQYATVRV